MIECRALAVIAVVTAVAAVHSLFVFLGTSIAFSFQLFSMSSLVKLKNL